MRPRLKRSRPEAASGDRVAGSGPFGRDGSSGLGGLGSGGGGVSSQPGNGPRGAAAASGRSRVGGAVCSPVRRSMVPDQPSRGPINSRISNGAGVTLPAHPAAHSACQVGASLAGRWVSQPQT